MYYMNEKGERVYTLKVRERGRRRARRIRDARARRRNPTDARLTRRISRRRKPPRMERRRNRRTRRDFRRMISFRSNESRWRSGFHFCRRNNRRLIS